MYWRPLALLIVASLALPALAEPPGSARFRAVLERVSPGLRSQLGQAGLRLGSPMFIRIFKESDELEVWVRKGPKFELFKNYAICTWSGALGPKLREGDGQSPEGFYFVKPAQLNPNSTFHLSFNLGFPNAYDRVHGRTGSFLMVHGSCVSVGCYAMTNARIEEVYTMLDAALRGGQPYVRVHVFPFRMTAANMVRHRTSRWHDFWRNLKQGHDHFEQHLRPPDVRVRHGRYVFAPTD